MVAESVEWGALFFFRPEPHRSGYATLSGEYPHLAGEVWEQNLEKTVFNSGMEYTFANVVSFRMGMLYDKAGQREELDFGLGFMLSDILQVDATFIKTISEGIRNGQKRFGLIFKF